MKVGIVGLGLIGGSLALALRDRHEVAGYDRSPATRGAAAAAGLAVVSRLEDVVGDVVIVATPLSEIVPVVQQLAPHADGCVVLDTGSLKGVIAEYAQHAPDRLRLVGGHPMAGATAAGFASADPDLFRGRAFLLVPTARSDDRSMGVAGDVARECGAVVTVCSAEVHDRAMARLIVAPLAAAAALAAGATDAAPLLSSAGPGFRDSTRLAETPLELALELLFGEPERSNAAIESVVEGLRQLRDRLVQGDRDYVRSFLLAAQAVRREMAAEPEASARLHGEA